MSNVTLALTSPHMRGDVIAQFQRDLNTRLKAWHVPFTVVVDGDYGKITRDTARSVLYGLGVDVGGDFDGVSPTDRIKVRHGWDRLTKAERDRHRARADWRKRYAEKMGGGAAGVALKFARDHIGVTEHPAGSNQGPEINKWAAACGLAPSRFNFWCGIFVNACLHAGGFPDQPWLIFCPTIEARAKARMDGWKWIPAGAPCRPGDLVLYGADTAEHVGLVEETANDRDTSTIEGNTSNGPGGSQSNGGVVARRHRHEDGSLAAFPIRGYARPPY